MDSSDDIYSAIKHGNVIRVRDYLESDGGAEFAKQHGGELLRYAASRGDTSVGKELIRHGVPLDLRDSHGWTALAYAAHKGHPGFVELLCRSGASLDGHPFGSSFEDFLDWATKYGTGSTPAMARTKAIIEATRKARRTNDAPQPPSWA